MSNKEKLNKLIESYVGASCKVMSISDHASFYSDITGHDYSAELEAAFTEQSTAKKTLHEFIDQLMQI